MSGAAKGTCEKCGAGTNWHICRPFAACLDLSGGEDYNSNGLSQLCTFAARPNFLIDGWRG